MKDQQAVGAEHVSLGSPSFTPAHQGTRPTEIPDPNGKSQARKLRLWQTALVQRSPKRDAEHLYWFCGLSEALGLDDDGTAAAMALSAIATAFHILAKLLAWHALAEVAKWIDGMAADARSLAGFPSLTNAADSQKHKTLYGIYRLNPSSEAQKHERAGAIAAMAVVVLDAIRRDRCADHHTIQRCNSMASGCRPESTRALAQTWRALARLAPFTTTKLQEFIAKCAEPEPLRLARRLHEAMQSKEEPLLPGSRERRGDDDVAPATFARAEQPTPSPPSPKEQPLQPAEPRRPSVLALKEAASYASMAETFGVAIAHNHLPPQRLSRVTHGCHEALRGEDGRLADQGLLLTMSLLVRSDFDITLNLSLRPGDGINIWYCPKKRCIRFDRRALRGLKPSSTKRDWGVVLVPPEAADRIEVLLSQRTDAEALVDLFVGRDPMRLASDTEAWIKTMSDAAHSAWSARAASSLGLVALQAGASMVEAAVMTLNLSLAAPSAPSYYATDPERHQKLMAKAFEALGYEVPPLVERDENWNPDVPTVDDVRREWAHVRDEIRASLAKMDGDDVSTVVDSFEKLMVGCRRAFELLTGARDQMRQNPTLRDVLASPDWIYIFDKPGRQRSARLLVLSKLLEDLIRVARLARDKLLARLVELGVQPDRLPSRLRRVSAEDCLFFHLEQKGPADKRRYEVRALDDTTMLLVSQQWNGPANMGRRFWLQCASEHTAWMLEQAISGHGRGLNNLGTTCLALPVMRILMGTRDFVQSTLDALRLSPVGEGIEGKPADVELALDLRSIDRRKRVGSGETDIPTHYCDTKTPAALVIVGALRTAAAKGVGLSHGARALLSLIARAYICHSADVADAWDELSKPSSGSGAPWISWTRPSGQPLRMPLEPITHKAADLVTDWPALHVAESELRAWLREQCATGALPMVHWPARRGATITALCVLVARWVRVHVAPFLVQAYRPSTLAAVLHEDSIARLLDPSKPLGSATAQKFGSRTASMRRRGAGMTDLAWLLNQVGAVTGDATPVGQRQKRSKKVLKRLQATVSEASDPAAIPGDYSASDEPAEDASEDEVKQAQALLEGVLPFVNPSALSDLGVMVLHWLELECALTVRRGPKHLKPSTIYKYISRVHAALTQHGRDLDPTEMVRGDWRRLTRAMLKRRADEAAGNADDRRIAWQRMLRTLAGTEHYSAAASALPDSQGAVSVEKYRPSAASTHVPLAAEKQLRLGIDRVFRDEPLARVQAHGILSLLMDPGMRRGEVCASRLSHLAEDGSFLVKMASGQDHLKTRRAVGPAPLSPQEGALLLGLKELMETIKPLPRYFFTVPGGEDDLHDAYAIYEVLVQITREVLGEEWHGHSHRGSAAVRRLTPSLESVIGRLASGPFRPADARRLMAELEGAGPHHLAEVLTGIGHASDRTFTRRYCAVWPILYAAAAHASLQEPDGLEVDAVPALPEGVRPKIDWLQAPRNATGRCDASLSPAQRLEYYARRRFGATSLAAMVDMRIGLSEGAALERALEGVPPLHVLAGEDDPADLPGRNGLSAAVNRLDESEGKALLAAVSQAAPTAREVVLGLLTDRASAPRIEVPHLRQALEMLPGALGIELGMLEKAWRDDLVESFVGDFRLQPVELEKRDRLRPRIRIRLSDPSKATHNLAGACTLLARVALAIANATFPSEVEQS